MDVRIDDVLNILRLLIGSAFLSYGSWTDWKQRIVRNRVWKYMGLAGLLILEIQILVEGLPGYFHLIIVTIFAIYVIILFDPAGRTDLDRSELSKPLYFSLVILGALSSTFFILTAMDGNDRLDAARYFFIPAFMGTIYGIYLVPKIPLFYGGADARAICFIALMMPFYPSIHLGGFHIPIFRPEEEVVQVVISYPLAIVINAQILFLGAPFVLATYNAFKREFKMPFCFTGYMMDTKNIPGSFVWIVEKAERPKTFRGRAAAGLRVFFPKRRGEMDPYLDLLDEHFDFVGKEVDFLYTAVEKNSSEDIKERSKLESEGGEMKEQEIELLMELLSCTEKSMFREMMEKEDTGMLRTAIQQVQVKRMEAAGKTRVWVSPKVPFIIPIAVSYVISFFIGGIVFELLIL